MHNTSEHTHMHNTSEHTHMHNASEHTHMHNANEHTHMHNTSEHTHMHSTSEHTHMHSTSEHTHMHNTSEQTHLYLHLPLDRTGYVATVQEVSQQEITRLVDSVSRYNNNHRYRRYRSQTIIYSSSNPRYPVTGEMMQYYLIAITSSVVLERTETHRSTCYSFAPSVSLAS